VLVTKGRLQTGQPGQAATLTIRARHLIDSVRAHYTGTPVMPPPIDQPALAQPAADSSPLC
jgi:hypothetical protein